MKALLISLLVCACLNGQTFVNNLGSGTGTSPVTATYAGNVGAGHLLVAAVITSVAITGVVSPIGNTWVKAISQSTGGNSMEIWYALNSTAGTESPVFTGSGGGMDIMLGEYSGVALTAALDQTAFSAGLNSGNVTTTATHELLFGFYISNAGGFPTAGSGYTLRNTFANNFLDADEDQTVTSIGTYAAIFTGGGGTNNTMLATFKAPSAAAFSPSQPVIIY